MALRGPSGRGEDGQGQDAPELRTGVGKYTRIRRNAAALDLGAVAAPVLGSKEGI